MVDDGSARRFQAHDGSLRYISILPVHSARRFIKSALDKACLSGARCVATRAVEGCSKDNTSCAADEARGRYSVLSRYQAR